MSPGRARSRQGYVSDPAPRYVLVQASVLMAFAIVIEAALSFLGLGSQPPTPELGLMLAEGNDYVTTAPWVEIFPGLAIAITVGGLRHVVRDPVSGQGRDADARRGETFGLVGESGCGKTTLSMALMGLLPSAARTSGEILFRGTDLTALSDAARRELRGSQISMIFQDPATSLDPTFGVGFQVAETIRAHRDVSRKEAKARALSLLTEVGIPDPAARYADPPHRLSGGMRQRVVLAAALASEPALLLADEPTTSLDVTIQAQILDLLAGLQREHDTTILLIGHDLGVIAQVCDRVGVMYAGQLAEVAATAELFAAPRHPYTRALLAALPTRAHGPGQLPVIPGPVPDLTRPPSGCRFKDRCPSAMAVCDTEPALVTAPGGHAVACWLHADADGAGVGVGGTLEGDSDD